MQLQYGPYAFTANECDVKATSETLVAGGRPYGRRSSLNVRGRMYTSGQNDTTTKMNLLIAALQVQPEDQRLECLGGVAGDRHLLRVAAEIGGQEGDPGE